jgi:hypothetical protein
VLSIFALASGRSGTHFLYELLRRNAVDCVCRHETYSWSNPSMFGRPIYDYAVGDLDAVRRQVALKARWVHRQRSAAYAETSHALLKSWFEVAGEFFADLRLVHLVWDVVQVARSEANREAIIHRWHVPFRFARGGNGRRFFRWALTGLEPIFQTISSSHTPFAVAGSDDTRSLPTTSWTQFQWYVLQWIEIENRAMRMLRQFSLEDRCLTLHSPHDLNDPTQVRRLFDFLGLQTRDSSPVIGGFKNATPGVRTVVTDEDRRQAAEVIARLPAEYLAIFQQPPYVDWPWSALLRPAGEGQKAPQ